MSKFSDLAAPLAEKFKITQKEADKFLSLMVDVLNDGLHDDKLVKIKGLGTFKVASMSARKSVNVNTGEPIVIEGREKISFTPDASLKERVNSAFAQFETTPVNEGVDFSEIDRKFDKQETAESIAEGDNETEKSESVIVSSVRFACKEKTDDENVVVEQAKIFENASVVSSLDKGRPEGGAISDKSDESEVATSATTTIDGIASDVRTNEEEPEEIEITSRSGSNRRLIYGTVALLLLLIVFGAFYFLRDASQPSPKVATAKHDTIQNAAKTSIKSPSDSVTTQNTNANSQFSTVNPDDYPVLKYGAYAFDGIAAEVTVKKGQTIKSISKTYLGPGSEQYVEAFNGKKVVKEGDIIKIPKLVLKKKK